jgi:hypothetical protein
MSALSHANGVIEERTLRLINVDPKSGFTEVVNHPHLLSTVNNLTFPLPRGEGIKGITPLA